MKRFAVAHINTFDNELTIEIVNANDWHQALMQHTKIGDCEFSRESLEKAQASAWDQDTSIDVVEIT